MTTDKDQVTIIQPSGSRWDAGLTELPRYRGFLYVLLWREIKVRYKQSVLGIGWAIVQPVVLMIVFSVIFGNIAKVPSNGVPYPIFSYVALLPWLLFQKALTQGSLSLVSYKGEMTKIYFPRIAAPLVSLMSAFVDFLIAFGVLALMMIYYGIVPGWPFLLTPLFIIYVGLSSLSVVLWLSAINVEYRDVQHLVPFLAQIWMFITPVVYPASLVPEKYAFLYWLNPMAAVVEGFRWAILGAAPPSLMNFAISSSMVVIMGISGLFYFNRVARTMADRV
jgi:lipopolysaccharide transport system permease protein